MQNSTESFNEKIQALRRHYGQQLPGRIAQIETTWQSLLATGWNPAVSRSLERMVHQLTGSAASFGLDKISADARALDTELKTLSASGMAPTAEQQSKINTLLASLHHSSAAVEHGTATDRLFHPLRLDEAKLREQSRESEQRLVFLVEDDLLLAQDLALQIGYFGYEVRIFEKLTALQAAIVESSPAALIMDIVFPEGDLAGAELMAEIQQTRVKAVPVVFISVRTDLIARLKSVMAGGDAYFVKPLDTSELIEKLDELTGRDIPDPFRILIVDDSNTTAAYHSAILEQAGMLTVIVTDPLRIMQPLVDFKPDMILMDMHMPFCTGLELAKVLRQQKAYFWLPIVFLSAEHELDKQMEALNTGGGDVFLTKPVVADHLISVTTSRVERSRTLRLLMIRDSLTELYNHTTIKDSLEHELLQAKRRDTPLAFAMLDIDRFKSINDAYGHAVGDHVLKSLARLLRQRLRKTDLIGRYGGEEFAVILPNTTGEIGLRVLNELRETFAQVRHQPIGQTDFSVTFSCGVAAFPARNDGPELSEAADLALYKAKRLGRNQVVLDGARAGTLLTNL